MPSRQINEFSPKGNRKKLVSGKTWCLVVGVVAAAADGGLAEGEGAWGSWAPPTIGLLDGLVRAAAVRSRAADGAGIAWLGNGAWLILGPLFDFSAALVTSALGLMKCDH